MSSIAVNREISHVVAVSIVHTKLALQSEILYISPYANVKEKKFAKKKKKE
jgi:hypothetical protein